MRSPQDHQGIRLVARIRSIALPAIDQKHLTDDRRERVGMEPIRERLGDP